MTKKKEKKKFYLKVFGIVQVKFENYTTRDTLIIIYMLPVIVVVLRLIFFR